MNLKSFQIKNCFGFGNSEEVFFDSKKNLYYILGINSSGKTSFLEAIDNFEYGKTPSENNRFTNFNIQGKNELLIMKFKIDNGEISSDILIDEIKEQVFGKGNRQSPPIESDKFVAFFNLIHGEYLKLINEIEKRKEVIILKGREGNYKFCLEETADKLYEKRKSAITNFISEIYSTKKSDTNKQYFTYKNTLYELSFSFEDIENILFLQFSPIYFFNNKYPLNQNLPDRIVKDDFNNIEDNFFGTFFKFLSKEDLKKYFQSEDPDERDKLKNQFQEKIDSLTKKINSENPDQELIKVRLSEKDGLQITFLTEKKPSYYRHLSDNTKFLFAYYLYSNVYEIDNAILLFDEPNKGFHPSSQQDLLNFLKQLAHSNTVIIATHSEYIIDPDFFKGVKLMSRDKNNRLIVKNNFHIKQWGKNESLALTPLYEAIGLKIRNNLNIKDKIIVTEGITDLYYIRAFKNILNYEEDISIAPVCGDSKMLTFIPFIISQGLSFKIVIDTNSKSRKK